MQDVQTNTDLIRPLGNIVLLLLCPLQKYDGTCRTDFKKTRSKQDIIKLFKEFVEEDVSIIVRGSHLTSCCCEFSHARTQANLLYSSVHIQINTANATVGVTLMSVFTHAKHTSCANVYIRVQSLNSAGKNHFVVSVLTFRTSLRIKLKKKTH